MAGKCVVLINAYMVARSLIGASLGPVCATHHRQQENMTGKDILSMPIGKIDYMKQGYICSCGAMISHPRIFGTHPEQLGWMPAHVQLHGIR